MSDVNAVLGAIQKAGLSRPHRPAMDVESEWDEVKTKFGGISNVPYTLLGDYLDKFNSALGFAYYCQGIADYESIAMKTRLEFVKELMFLSKPVMSNKDTQYALVMNEPEVIKLTAEYTKEYGKWKIISAMVNSYERKAEAISREITRRGSEASIGGRASNVGGTV